MSLLHMVESMSTKANMHNCMYLTANAKVALTSHFNLRLNMTASKEGSYYD